MSKVFIPQEPRKRDGDDWKPLYDLSPAVRFGTLEVLLPHGPVLLDTAVVIASLQEKLQHITKEDYVMLIGDPSAIAAVVMVAAHMNGGFLKILKYDRTERQYNVVEYQV